MFLHCMQLQSGPLQLALKHAKDAKFHTSPATITSGFSFGVVEISGYSDAADNLKAANARAEQAAKELLEMEADEKAKSDKQKAKNRQRKAKQSKWVCTTHVSIPFMNPLLKAHLKDTSEYR